MAKDRVSSCVVLPPLQRVFGWAAFEPWTFEILVELVLIVLVVAKSVEGLIGSLLRPWRLLLRNIIALLLLGSLIGVLSELGELRKPLRPLLPVLSEPPYLPPWIEDYC